jgi:membrane protein YdbS with pleckstrin-like domain
MAPWVQVIVKVKRIPLFLKINTKLDSRWTNMQIGEPFRPNPKMMVLYTIYLLAIIIPLYSLGAVLIVLNILYFKEPLFIPVIVAVFLAPLTIASLFALYWIPKYFGSIKYLMSDNDVRVEIGVWWKMRHAIPYSRIMNVDTIQGPLSRRLGIGTVDIYTAGYTGQGGGSGGPGIRRSEAAFIHVGNFLELRESVLDIVKGRPLFSSTGTTANTNSVVLDELRQIRELLTKISNKP